jgi:hypothetical protein
MDGAARAAQAQPEGYPQRRAVECIRVDSLGRGACRRKTRHAMGPAAAGRAARLRPGESRRGIKLAAIESAPRRITREGSGGGVAAAATRAA